jgi:hypothetical protein
MQFDQQEFQRAVRACGLNVISHKHSGIALVRTCWRERIQAFEPNSNALGGRFLALQPVKRFAGSSSC